MTRGDAGRTGRTEERLARLTRRLDRLRGSRHLIERLRRHYDRRRPDPDWYVVPDFAGHLSLKVDRAAAMGGAIYWYGSHSYHVREVLRRVLRGGMTFVDVGANHGEVTVHAASLLPHGRVLAFEPVAEVFELLRENVRMNRLGNVSLHPLALAAEPGELTFHAPLDGEEEGRRHEGLHSRFSAGKRTRVTGRASADTLDRVLEREGVGRVDVIKLDIEGGELDALRGARKTLLQRPRLVIEINRETSRWAGHSPEELLSWLGEVGYRRFRAIDYRGRLHEWSRWTRRDLCDVYCE